MLIHRKSRGFTLIEMMVVVAIVGILAAVAIPNFNKFQTRAKQSEVKANLATFFALEKSNYAADATFLCGLCGFKPEGRNMYTYRVDNTDANTIATDPNRPDAASLLCAPTGASPSQTTAKFVAIGYANIDTDSTCDTWSINELNVLTNVTNDVDL